MEVNNQKSQENQASKMTKPQMSVLKPDGQLPVENPPKEFVPKEEFVKLQNIASQLYKQGQQL